MPIPVDKHLLLGELSTGGLYAVGHAMTLRNGSSKTSTKTNRKKVKLWQRKRYWRFHYNKQLIEDLYLAVKYTSEQNQTGSGKRFTFIHPKNSDVTAIHLTTHPPHVLLLNTQFWKTQGFSCLFVYLVSAKTMHSSALQNPKDSKWTGQFFHLSSNTCNFIHIMENSFNSLQYPWCKSSAMLACIIHYLLLIFLLFIIILMTSWHTSAPYRFHLTVWVYFPVSRPQLER